MSKLAKMVLVLCVAALVCAGVSACALTFGDVAVSETVTVGAGSNSAMCVIDFGTASFAFLYKFDGVKTGYDMLKDLDAPNTGLDVTHSWSEEYGAFVSDFAYNGQAKRQTVGDWPSWRYYNSVDGVNWSDNGPGCSSRTIVDGSWDAWNWTAYNVDWDTFEMTPTAPPPVTPLVAPVPEPSSLLALSSLIGLVASPKLLRRRSK